MSMIMNNEMEKDRCDQEIQNNQREKKLYGDRTKQVKKDINKSTTIQKKNENECKNIEGIIRELRNRL